MTKRLVCLTVVLAGATAALHAQLAQQRDVRWRPAEARDADASPLAHDRGEPDMACRERAQEAGWNSSMGLPAGSSSTICEPPGPVMTSLRNVSPAARSFPSRNSLARSTSPL